MKVIINGIDGAMGSILARIIASTDDMEVIAGVTPTGADGAYLTMDAYQGPADMVIDFSHHSVTAELMDYCVKRGLPAVVCTTGQFSFSDRVLMSIFVCFFLLISDLFSAITTGTPSSSNCVVKNKLRLRLVASTMLMITSGFSFFT